MNHVDEYYKHQTIQAYKEYIKNFYKDHFIFFITYTFQNSFIKLSPMPALTAFYRNLRNAACNRPNEKDKSVKLLCIHEKSHSSKVFNMEKANHYHCFFTLPYSYKDRFYRKAVKKEILVFDGRLDKHVPITMLNEDVYKYLPERQNPDADPILINYDINVKRLCSPEDVEATFNYATKNVTAYKQSLTLEQIHAFQKGQLKQKQFKSIKTDEDQFILFGQSARKFAEATVQTDE